MEREDLIIGIKDMLVVLVAISQRVIQHIDLVGEQHTVFLRRFHSFLDLEIEYLSDLIGD